MPREILVEWTTPSGNDHRSVFWFDLLGTVATQRINLAAFLGTVDGGLDNNVSWTIATEGREVNDATGILQGVWADSNALGGTGGVAGEMVPDAAQVLIRWLTPNIVGGRFLKGRTFIPGLANGNMVNGNLSAGIVDVLATAGQALADEPNSVGVWHRPVLKAGGDWVQATSCSVWNELAVLRRRR